MKFLIAFLVLVTPAVAAESWYTAMTPLDPRPPLPKPSEPDGGDRNGPFRAPAPAVVKASAKARPKAKAKPKAEAAVEPTPPPAAKTSVPGQPNCQCEPCECGKPAPQATTPQVDPRLTRDAAGNYFGTAPGGQVYYSPDPNAVLRAITLQTQYTTSFATAPAYCTTGTCPR